jgi:hypothetical protein
MTTIAYQTSEQRFVDSCILIYNLVPYPKPEFNVWVGQQIEQMFESWRDQTQFDRLLVGEFMSRNPAAFARISVASANDPVLPQLMARIQGAPEVWLASVEAQQAVGYLLQAGYISSEEATALLSYNRPQIIPEPTPQPSPPQPPVTP